MFVGVDVAKGELVVALRPDAAAWAVADTEPGIQTLVERLTQRAPTLVVFYQRLLATGKPKKLAPVACMRKLLTTPNAMARSNTRWGAAAAPVMA